MHLQMQSPESMTHSQSGPADRSLANKAVPSARRPSDTLSTDHNELRPHNRYEPYILCQRNRFSFRRGELQYTNHRAPGRYFCRFSARSSISSAHAVNVLPARLAAARRRSCVSIGTRPSCITGVRTCSPGRLGGLPMRVWSLLIKRYSSKLEICLPRNAGRPVRPNAPDALGHSARTSDAGAQFHQQTAPNRFCSFMSPCSIS